jgi:hypothetical protein
MPDRGEEEPPIMKPTRAPDDQDGSALRDNLSPYDPCPKRSESNNSDAVEIIQSMRGQAGDFIAALAEKLEFKRLKIQPCHATPDTLWVAGQEIRIEHFKLMSLLDLSRRVGTPKESHLLAADQEGQEAWYSFGGEASRD